MQINPIWLWGPYNPAQVSAASQPDWYIGFLEGSMRLFPAWEINLPGSYQIPAPFWPTVFLPGVLFTLLALYLIIERKLTRDTASRAVIRSWSPRRTSGRWRSSASTWACPRSKAVTAHRGRGGTPRLVSVPAAR